MAKITRSSHSISNNKKVGTLKNQITSSNFFRNYKHNLIIDFSFALGIFILAALYYVSTH